MSTARGIFAYACFPLTKRRVISGYGNGCSSHHHCGRMLASTAPKPLGETNMAMAEPPAPPFPQKQLDSTSAHAAVNTNYSPRLQQVVVEKGGTTDYEEIEHFEDVDPADWLDERRGAFKGFFTQFLLIILKIKRFIHSIVSVSHGFWPIMARYLLIMLFLMLNQFRT